MNARVRRIRPWAGNLALALASIAFTLGVLELAAPWLLPRLPLKLHFTLDRYQRVLAQTSKEGVVPEPPYVAILGDSYAMGLGDWLLDANANTNPPYHAAHVLHHLLGADVVSFGRSGDSNMGAWVKRPFQTRRYLSTTRFALPEPSLYVAYFYEGNDLEDNLRDLSGSFAGPWDADRLRDPAYFESYLEQEWVEEERPWRWTPSLNDRPVVSRVIRKTLTHALTGWPEGFEPHPIHPAETNRARMKDGVRPLPEPLQSASVSLSEADFEQALWVFERSLRFLVEHEPEVPVLLVLVPAPVTVYPMSSPEVSILSGKEGDDEALLRPREAVARRADRLCAHLAKTAAELGTGFLDSRHALWPAARERFLHGPRDWAHFNRRGYTELARALAPAIEPILAGEAPARGRCADVSAYFASIPVS